MERTDNETQKNAKKDNTGYCPKCDQSDGSIQCQICTFWWHPTCGGLGREEYELFVKLAELGNPGLWQCLTCKVGMGDLGLRWERTGKIVAENRARLDIIETKIEKQEVKVDSLGHDLMKTKEELEKLKKSMDVMKKEAIQISLTEINERESNHSNVMIHNVPESNSNEPSVRQAHDLKKLQIILRELGLLKFIQADLREHVKFIRRIGERKEQEARPIKVGFIFYNMKERLMESAKYLNRIPALRHIGIAHDLTEMQEKGLVKKVVGARGQRRIIMAPLRRREEVDQEGRVILRNRSSRSNGAENKEQEQARNKRNVSGACREPLARKEQGNEQGAAGGRSRREEQERAAAGTKVEQLRQGQEQNMRTGRRFQSFGSVEEEGRRKEQGRSSTILLQRVSTSGTDPRLAMSGRL
jgi:hypothetical protein